MENPLVKRRGRPPKAESQQTSTPDILKKQDSVKQLKKQETLSKQLMKEVLESIKLSMLNNKQLQPTSQELEQQDFDLLDQLDQFLDNIVSLNTILEELELLKEEIVNLLELKYKNLLNSYFDNLPTEDDEYKIYDPLNNLLYESLSQLILLTIRFRRPISGILYPIYYTDFTIDFLKMMKFLFGHLIDDVTKILNYNMLLIAVQRYNLSHRGKQRTIKYLNPITWITKTESK